MCKSLILQIKKKAKKGEVTCTRLFSQVGTESGQEPKCVDLIYCSLVWPILKKNKLC